MECDLPAHDELAPPAPGRVDGLRQVLLALAPGQAVPAQRLAERSGMTQAMVAGSVEALRALGLPVRSPRPACYQLPWPLQLLDAERIGALLPTVGAVQPGAFELHFELDSTSSELQRRGAGAPDLGFVLAEMQSAGRGRRGRQWLSPPGLNLYVSCLKRFDRGAGELAGLSLVVGLSVLRALAALGIRAAGLKWPNDVQARSGPAAGGKLAGILVELGSGPSGRCTAVVGVGLNLRLTEAMRGQVAQATCDLATLNGGVPPDRNLAAATLMAVLAQGLLQFESDGFAPFQAEYARHDLLRDQPLQISGALGTFTGVGAGIDARGALRVRLADGGLRTVDSAEVTVRRT